MIENRTVTTLKSKRDEITRTFVNYESKIDQAKVDPARQLTARGLDASDTVVAKAISYRLIAALELDGVAGEGI